MSDFTSRPKLQIILDETLDRSQTSTALYFVRRFLVYCRIALILVGLFSAILFMWLAPPLLRFVEGSAIVLLFVVAVVAVLAAAAVLWDPIRANFPRRVSLSAEELTIVTPSLCVHYPASKIIWDLGSSRFDSAGEMLISRNVVLVSIGGKPLACGWNDDTRQRWVNALEHIGAQSCPIVSLIRNQRRTHARHVTIWLIASWISGIILSSLTELMLASDRLRLGIVLISLCSGAVVGDHLGRPRAERVKLPRFYALYLPVVSALAIQIPATWTGANVAERCVAAVLAALLGLGVALLLGERRS